MKGATPKKSFCAKCDKPFLPTPQRQLTCESCFKANSQISPLAEEPETPKSKKTTPADDSIFKMIHNSPTKISR